MGAERRAKRIGVAVALLGFLSAGCSTECLVDSHPQGAEVQLDDKRVGVTPCHVNLSNSGFRSSYELKVSKPGYATDARQITLAHNNWTGTNTWPMQIFIRLVKNDPEPAPTNTTNTAPVNATPTANATRAEASAATDPSATKEASTETEKKFCTSCGKKVAREAKFCAECGGKQ